MYGEGDAYSTEEVTDLEALERIDIDTLPPLRPPDRLPMREALQTGKNVIAYLRMLEKENSNKTELWDILDVEETTFVQRLTDDELWTILKCRPILGEPALEVTDKWVAWAKKIFTSGKGILSDKEYICRVLNVAFSCYDSLANAGIDIDGYHNDIGIEYGRFFELYNSIVYLNEDEIWDHHTFCSLIDPMKNLLLSPTNHYILGTCYRLTLLR